MQVIRRKLEIHAQASFWAEEEFEAMAVVLLAAVLLVLSDKFKIFLARYNNRSDVEIKTMVVKLTQ